MSLEANYLKNWLHSPEPAAPGTIKLRLKRSLNFVGRRPTSAVSYPTLVRAVRSRESPFRHRCLATEIPILVFVQRHDQRAFAPFDCSVKGSIRTLEICAWVDIDPTVWRHLQVDGPARLMCRRLSVPPGQPSV